MSRDILIDLIDADPDQPRRHFDADQLAELAASIAENGLAVPILLRPVGERFVIVCGERRFRACRSLGWTEIPAEVREMDLDTAKWLALAENIQRSDLTPIEVAQAYAAALATGMTQQQLAERIGKKQPDIAQKLRLLKLAPEVQEAVAAGTISEGIARQLLRLDAARHTWRVVVDKSVADGWSVRRAKNYVDYQLLVEYPRWWDVVETIIDLVEFEKRLRVECLAGYAPKEEHLRVERALGHHFTFLGRVGDATSLRLAVFMYKEWPLSLLNEHGKWLAKCDAYGIDTRAAVKARIFLDTGEDALQRIKSDEIDHEDIDSLFFEIVRRAAACFDADPSYQVEEQVSEQVVEYA